MGATLAGGSFDSGHVRLNGKALKPDRPEARDLDARLHDIDPGHQPQKIHLQPAAHPDRKAGKPAKAHMQVAAVFIEMIEGTTRQIVASPGR